MSGPVAKPPAQRRRRNRPARGEWQPALGSGWQHGDVPRPPDGLKEASLEAWQTWFHAWFASHWSPDDVPGLRIVVNLYDQVERGEYVRASELRQLMDDYGITPKGQQERRWAPPVEKEPKQAAQPAAQAGKFAHLKVVGE